MNTKTKICKYYTKEKGCCFGNSCKYIHEDTSSYSNSNRNTNMDSNSSNYRFRKSKIIEIILLSRF